MPTRLINADEQQRASLTLRLNAPQVPLPNTGEQPFLNRPLRGLVRGRDVRSPWRNVSGAFVACRNLDSSSPSAKRHPRSGATPSPFRRNGIAVPAQRHRRSGAKKKRRRTHRIALPCTTPGAPLSMTKKAARLRGPPQRTTNTKGNVVALNLRTVPPQT